MSFFCPKRFCLVTGSRCGLKRAENKEIRVRRATEDALLVGRNLIGERRISFRCPPIGKPIHAIWGGRTKRAEQWLHYLSCKFISNRCINSKSGPQTAPNGRFMQPPCFEFALLWFKTASNEQSGDRMTAEPGKEWTAFVHAPTMQSVSAVSLSLSNEIRHATHGRQGMCGIFNTHSKLYLSCTYAPEQNQFS